eukprot:gnl/Chilomastix_caulleri/1267.p1 GENE.gnl/Chilomastix_caulleri/1267~~gnl/Chilomastix_caulleri/1267.p1  ORF type:complete len:247 (-),score=51.82 gnl/Chilomastix_caulleri/1267:51-791(-)
MVIRLNITHSHLRETFMEVRFHETMTVGALKARLSTMTMTEPHFQRLVLKDQRGNTLRELGDDGQVLGCEGLEDFMTIHVVDLNPHSLAKELALADLTKVKKFELTDEQYEARDVNVRKWKESLYANDEEYRRYVERRDFLKANMDERFAEEAKAISQGARCEVSPGGMRGTVRYVGKIPELHPGFWVGVELDEPRGKHNGTAGGHRYFEADNLYGVFVRPFNVEVGDFPEVDIMEDLGESSVSEL